MVDNCGLESVDFSTIRKSSLGLRTNSNATTYSEYLTAATVHNRSQSFTVPHSKNTNKNRPYKIDAEPWLEEDATEETRKFVQHVEEILKEFLVQQTGVDKLTLADVIDQENKFAQPYICHICQNVAQESVQCAHCKQIFDRQCITDLLRTNEHCTQCNLKFECEEVNPNLKLMFGQIKFRCKFCQGIYHFPTRSQHLMECHKVVITRCPFGCTNLTGRFVDHFNKECERQLKCGACAYPIYRRYGNQGQGPSSEIISTGHNCLRDNPTSPQLMLSLRKMQMRAHSSLNNKLEENNQLLRQKLNDVKEELVLYKGPIPEAAKPTVNDLKLFKLTRAENAPSGMAENCKGWIIDAILIHGFTDEAIRKVITELQASYGSHWRVMILTLRQHNAIASLAACSGTTIFYSYTKQDYEMVIQIQEVV